MALAELQQLACDLELKACATHTLQAELLRTIQALRGDGSCFSTDERYDCVEICEWRKNCHKPGTI